MSRTNFFSNLAVVHWDVHGWISNTPPSDVTPSLSATDSLSGISLVTNLTVCYTGPLVLNTPNYPLVPHSFLPENEICNDNQEEDNYFTMSHRYTLGSKGHFWFLQVGLKYEGENDSKMTLLLGLSALMAILPSAIDGFELHPLDETSSHPALTNNRVENGFPSSDILAFKYCGVKNKQFS